MNSKVMRYLWVVPPLLVLFFAWVVLWNPRVQQHQKRQIEMAQFQSLSDSLTLLQARLDSLQSVHQAFSQWIHPLEQSLLVKAPLPDSMASMARQGGLTVTDMEVSEPVGVGPNHFIRVRMVVRGGAGALVHWLDTLQQSSGLVRLERFQWVAQGAEFALRPVEWRLWTLSDSLPYALGASELLRHFAQSLQDSLQVPTTGALEWQRFLGGRFLVVKTPTPSSMAMPPSAPRLILGGIVAGRLANATDSRGAKLLLKLGTQVEGWTVVAIESDGVLLEHNGVSHRVGRP